MLSGAPRLTRRHGVAMFPSTPSSKSISKASARVNHSNGPMQTPPSYLTRSRIPLAERIQKRINRIQGKNENYESPSKRKGASTKAPRVSPSPSKFGRERMVRATSGHFKRPSLEANCLSAQGEDAATFFQDPPLYQQQLAGSSSIPTWGESPSFNMSFNRSSNLSFNLNSSRADFSPLSNLESPLSRTAKTQIRARVRGHMRAASRSLVHETIEEEAPGVDSETPIPAITSLQLCTPEALFLESKKRMDTRETLKHYHALKLEAETTVTESKKQWIDTPYSISAVQNFQPPCDVEAMHSLLEDSMKNYRPLPSELRHHRRRSSRTFSSRMSPYAHARMSRLMSPQKSIASPSPSSKKTRGNLVAEASSPSLLQEIAIKRNSFATPAPNSAATDPFTPLNKRKSGKETPRYASPLKMKSVFGRPPASRQGVSLESHLKAKSVHRQASPSKQSVTSGKSTKHTQRNKENEQPEPLKTPGGSLRVDRPRPRYRTPTPGPKRRSVRK
ncbi:hypothetical protein AX15_003635 [Amanita polypyramis BW_CC]|nr:hypothetical protein AX15_003635 [Amanita polypyramis BW_CC]